MADKPLLRKKNIASAGAPASLAGAERPCCDPSSSVCPFAGLAWATTASTWSMVMPAWAPFHNSGPLGTAAAAPMVSKAAAPEAIAATRMGDLRTNEPAGHSPARLHGQARGLGRERTPPH